jgi:hypothetical protein
MVQIIPLLENSFYLLPATAAYSIDFWVFDIVAAVLYIDDNIDVTPYISAVLWIFFL